MTSMSVCPRSQGLFTLDIEEITAALRTVMFNVRGLMPLAEGGHGAVLRVHRNGGGDALVVKVVPVDDRLALEYELQCLTYVRQAGIHSPAPALPDVVFTGSCACMVMGYVEGHEARTVGDAAAVGRELARLHALPLPVFAAQGSFMGLPLLAQGIVPTEMKTLLPCDPWEMAGQLASENLAIGLSHGDFMPSNILTDHSGATLLDFGNMGRDCFGADVARYCLGGCLAHQITNETLLCESFLGGYSTIKPLDSPLVRCLPKLVYLAGFRIALWRYSHRESGLSWRDPLRVGAAWLTGDIHVRGSWS